VSALRAYLLVVLAANLTWETAQLPLYTIWATGTTREIVVAVAHCTGGDLLIAIASLTLALVLAGPRSWPGDGHLRIAALTILFGAGYTVFSEHLNIVARESWAYSDLMPVLPVIGTGISPLLQWIAIPVAALWLARRSAVRKLRLAVIKGAEPASINGGTRRWTA
jgi:hypothetical protein